MLKRTAEKTPKSKMEGKARRKSVLEIFDALPATPVSAKANAAFNAFTVAKEKGENAHHAMINALTLSNLSSTTSLSRKHCTGRSVQ